MDLINNQFTKEEFRLDFVIPHINYERVKESILSIRRNTPQENVGKIILINQSGIDYPWIKELTDVCVTMPSVGFAKAVNTGIRLSDASFVAIWNDDCFCVNKRWASGVAEIFNRYGEKAAAVNPCSPRNPAYSGGPPTNPPEYDYEEKWSDDKYDSWINNIGKGYVYDGACFWATIFNRLKLDQVAGTIQGKCWLDERFIKSGGEDMDHNIRTYSSGMRILGGGGVVFHYWYSSRRDGELKGGVKFDGNTLDSKWTIERNGKKIKPDIFGMYYDEGGNKIIIGKDGVGQDIYLKAKREDVPLNIIRE